jgi:hypothetical protein
LFACAAWRSTIDRAELGALFKRQAGVSKFDAALKAREWLGKMDSDRDKTVRAALTGGGGGC